MVPIFKKIDLKKLEVNISITLEKNRILTKNYFWSTEKIVYTRCDFLQVQHNFIKLNFKFLVFCPWNF